MVDEAKRGRDRFGPGVIVAAAFIGPGTVTTASVAGARFGAGLLWAVVFSIFASVVLQEMAARLGLVTGAGFGEAVRRTFTARWARTAAVGLVIAAIGVGNAAFQVGNLTGAALGLGELTGTAPPLWVGGVGLAAFGLLWSGRYRSIERALVALVAAMSAVFLATAVLARPDAASLAAGVLRPSLPPGSLLTVVALIGTTVVPYNLFLHASAAARKWGARAPAEALAAARLDTLLSIGLGGGITASIVVTASTAFAPGTEIASAAAMAHQLEPSLGGAAESCFLLGLFAAGLTSAVTAPLAAAYATGGCLGWPADLKDRRLRAVWLAVLMVGVVLAALGRRPLAAIVAVQALNGALLPLIAVVLVAVLNRRALLGPHRNGRIANLLAAAVVAVTVGLGGTQLLSALGWIG